MKQKFLFSFVALLLSMQVMATNLVIERMSGADMQQNIALIGKWVFVGDNLQLIDKDGHVLATENVVNIRKIVFAESASTSVEQATKDHIVVYPNPTQEKLYVLGAEAQILRVYDLQGRVVIVGEGTEVSVGNLPTGTYLLQIGTQVVRFIKQ